MRSSRAQLLLAEVSLAKLATGSSSRKGSYRLSPKGRKYDGQPRGEGTTNSKELRMLMAVTRAVPWSKSQEQGEIL